MPSITELAAIAFAVLLSWAAASDFFTRIIPNQISALIACAFVVCAASAGFPGAKIAAHFGCGAVLLVCGFILYARRVIGGGDAKLLAAAALWFGFERLVPFLALTTMAGGVLALIYLVRNAAHAGFGVDTSPDKTIPYGAAIAAGGLLLLPKIGAGF